MLNECELCGGDASILYESVSDRMGNAPGAWDIFKCNNQKCSFVWINPMPSQNILSTAYENYYTHAETAPPSSLRRLYERARNCHIRKQFGYPATNDSSLIRFVSVLVSLIPHRRVGMDAMAMWLPYVPGGALLEIGCGNGDRLALLRDLGWDVHGIEPDPCASNSAQNKGLTVLEGALQADTFPAASFDAILMSHVIEHVENPSELIKNCRYLLKPGGVLVMLTPNTGSFGHRWFGRDWLHLDPPRHLHLFNASNMKKICLDAGYGDVGCRFTARDAQWTLGGSLALRKYGRYRIGQLPAMFRLAGLFLSYIELLLLPLFKSRGEEICITAKEITNGRHD